MNDETLDDLKTKRIGFTLLWMMVVSLLRNLKTLNYFLQHIPILRIDICACALRSELSNALALHSRASYVQVTRQNAGKMPHGYFMSCYYYNSNNLLEIYYASEPKGLSERQKGVIS